MSTPQLQKLSTHLICEIEKVYSDSSAGHHISSSPDYEVDLKDSEATRYEESPAPRISRSKVETESYYWKCCLMLITKSLILITPNSSSSDLQSFRLSVIRRLITHVHKAPFLLNDILLQVREMATLVTTEEITQIVESAYTIMEKSTDPSILLEIVPALLSFGSLGDEQAAMVFQVIMRLFDALDRSTVGVLDLIVRALVILKFRLVIDQKIASSFVALNRRSLLPSFSFFRVALLLSMGDIPRFESDICDTVLNDLVSINYREKLSEKRLALTKFERIDESRAMPFHVIQKIYLNLAQCSDSGWQIVIPTLVKVGLNLINLQKSSRDVDIAELYNLGSSLLLHLFEHQRDDCRKNLLTYLLEGIVLKGESSDSTITLLKRLSLSNFALIQETKRLPFLCDSLVDLNHSKSYEIISAISPNLKHAPYLVDHLITNFRKSFFSSSESIRLTACAGFCAIIKEVLLPQYESVESATLKESIDNNLCGIIEVFKRVLRYSLVVKEYFYDFMKKLAVLKSLPPRFVCLLYDLLTTHFGSIQGTDDDLVIGNGALEKCLSQSSSPSENLGSVVYCLHQWRELYAQTSIIMTDRSSAPSAASSTAFDIDVVLSEFGEMNESKFLSVFELSYRHSDDDRWDVDTLEGTRTIQKTFLLQQLLESLICCSLTSENIQSYSILLTLNKLILKHEALLKLIDDVKKKQRKVAKDQKEKISIIWQKITHTPGAFIDTNSLKKLIHLYLESKKNPTQRGLKWFHQSESYIRIMLGAVLENFISMEKASLSSITVLESNVLFCFEIAPVVKQLYNDTISLLKKSSKEEVCILFYFIPVFICN
jgi:hypothetical protein